MLELDDELLKSSGPDGPLPRGGRQAADSEPDGAAAVRGRRPVGARPPAARRREACRRRPGGELEEAGG